MPFIRDRCSVCLSVMLVYCDPTVGWIKMPLDTKVVLGPGCVWCWTELPNGKGHISPPLFGPCILWPNGQPSQQLLSFWLKTYESWNAFHLRVPIRIFKIPEIFTWGAFSAISLNCRWRMWVPLHQMQLSRLLCLTSTCSNRTLQQKPCVRASTIRICRTVRNCVRNQFKLTFVNSTLRHITRIYL